MDKELKELLERIADGLEEINNTLEGKLNDIDVTLGSLFEFINEEKPNDPSDNDNAVR